MRGLWVVAAAAVVVAAVVMLTRDPEEAWAIAAVIAGLSIAAGALVVAVLLRAPRPGRRRGAVREGVAIRRGIEVTTGVALLLWLRVVDGLSLITAGFVIGAFVVAETVLSASARPSR